MRKLVVVALFLLCAAVSPSALRASMIDYHFTFTNLSNGDANFSIDILSPTFITTTGVTTSGSPIPTSLGYTINDYGENIFGSFGFWNSDGGISDTPPPTGSVDFNSQSFDFSPTIAQSDYFQSYGTFTGFTIGNDPTFFDATATLTITPEPSTIGLLGTGLTSLLYIGRRRFLRS